MAPGWRRPIRVGVLGVLALVAVGVVVARPGAEPSAEGELRRRLARTEEPNRFSLDYERGGSGVVGCMLSNTRFTIDVDIPAGAMAVRRGGGATVALADSEVLLLHGDLFRNPPFTTPWLAGPRDPAASTAPALERVLGADLAAYLLAAQLPASGRSTVVAVLEAASSVERIDPLVTAGARAQGYRLRLDPERFAAATLPEATTSASPTVTPVPLVDVWVTNDGNVVRVSIRPQTNAGRPGPVEDGWTIAYGRTSAVAPAAPVPGETTDIAEVDASALLPAAVGCELGG